MIEDAAASKIIEKRSTLNGNIHRSPTAEAEGKSDARTALALDATDRGSHVILVAACPFDEPPPHSKAKPGDRGQDESVGRTEQAIVEGAGANAAQDGELIT